MFETVICGVNSQSKNSAFEKDLYWSSVMRSRFCEAVKYRWIDRWLCCIFNFSHICWYACVLSQSIPTLHGGVAWCHLFGALSWARTEARSIGSQAGQLEAVEVRQQHSYLPRLTTSRPVMMLMCSEGLLEVNTWFGFAANSCFELVQSTQSMLTWKIKCVKSAFIYNFVNFIHFFLVGVANNPFQFHAVINTSDFQIHLKRAKVQPKKTQSCLKMS